MIEKWLIDWMGIVISQLVWKYETMRIMYILTRNVSISDRGSVPLQPLDATGTFWSKHLLRDLQMWKVKVLEQWLCRIRTLLSYDGSQNMGQGKVPNNTIYTRSMLLCGLFASVAWTFAADNAPPCSTFFACCRWDKVSKVPCRQTSKPCFWKCACLWEQQLAAAIS